MILTASFSFFHHLPSLHSGSLLTGLPGIKTLDMQFGRASQQDRDRFVIRTIGSNIYRI